MTIGIEGGSSETVDLVSLQDGTGTDDQNISGSSLSGTTLTIGIEGGSSETVDLSSLSSTGLEKITEGTNSGWRFIGANPANYGDIGNNAQDLSFSSTASTVNGASGNNSTAMGYNTQASGTYSTSMGAATTASGAIATAMGVNTTASGNNSTAMGVNTTASGTASTAMGHITTASGISATAMGAATTASGLRSTAMGYNTTAPSYAETALGIWNSTYTPNSTNSFNNADRLFVIGNGTSNSAKSNALTIYKDGRMNINDAYTMPTADGGANQVLTTDGSGTVTWNNPAADGDWSINASGHMSNGNSGNVGIGTTSPNARLHVNLPSSDNTTNYGIYNYYDGSTNSTKYGFYNQMLGSGNGDSYAVYNDFDNTGTGAKYGMRNDFADVVGTKYGLYNNFPSGTATGNIFGVYNYIANDANANKYGVYNYISGGEGFLTGSYNQIIPSSTNSSTIYGVYGDVSSAGTGRHYGVYGSAYGDDNRGVYGSNTHTNGWAGYFEGNGYWNGNLIFNEYGTNDHDFRIESDTRQYAFFVDSGEDIVRIGASNGFLSGNGTTVSGTNVDYVADFDRGSAILNSCLLLFFQALN